MAERVSNIIDAKELAERLDLDPVTLRLWRAADKGPPFIKVPGSSSIRYLWTEVQAWLSQGHVYPGETDGMRAMRLRAQGGTVERAEYDSAKHKVPVSGAEVRAHVERERGAR